MMPNENSSSSPFSIDRAALKLAALQRKLEETEVIRVPAEPTASAVSLERIRPWVRSMRSEFLPSGELLEGEVGLQEFFAPLLRAFRETHPWSFANLMPQLKGEEGEVWVRETSEPSFLWLNETWAVAAAFQQFVPPSAHELQRLQGALPLLVFRQGAYEDLADEVNWVADATGFRPSDLLGHILIGEPAAPQLPVMRIRWRGGFIPGDLQPVRHAEVLFSRPPTMSELRELRSYLVDRLPDPKVELLRELVVKECERLGIEDPTSCRAPRVFEHVARQWPAGPEQPTAKALLHRWRRLNE